MNRILNVVRLQLVNRQTFVWIPLIVLGGALALSVLVWALVPFDGPKYGGGTQAPVWYYVFVGVQALTLTFPFSQALSLTRREYFLGTMAISLLSSLMLGVIYILGGLFEQATGGWWVNGYFFYLPWVWDHGALGAGLLVTAVFLLALMSGLASATAYKRFGALWLVVILLAIGLLLVGLVVLITRLEVWAPVVEWFVAIGPAGLGGLLLALVAVMAAGSYGVLRRAIP